MFYSIERPLEEERRELEKIERNEIQGEYPIPFHYNLAKTNYLIIGHKIKLSWCKVIQGHVVKRTLPSQVF